jgi:hypothetical protein
MKIGEKVAYTAPNGNTFDVEIIDIKPYVE